MITESARQYLVVYEDEHGDVDTVVMATSLPPEIAVKSLHLYRVLNCEEFYDEEEYGNDDD